MPRREAWAIGMLMNTRGLMELVVVNIGLDLGVIPHSVFFMLVLMAVVTTYMTAPLVRTLRDESGAWLETPAVARVKWQTAQRQTAAP